MTSIELSSDHKEVYSNLEWRNNRLGYLGELAVDKALSSLGIDYESNPKDNAEDFKREQGGGPDHKIKGINIEIETKNLGNYPFDRNMIYETLFPRFNRKNETSDGLRKLFIGTNLNVSDRNDLLIGSLGIFIISIGFQIKKENFERAVRIFRGKIINFLRIHHKEEYQKIIYSSCNRGKKGENGEDISVDLATLLSSLPIIIDNNLISSSNPGRSIVYINHKGDPPPLISIIGGIIGSSLRNKYQEIKDRISPDLSVTSNNISLDEVSFSNLTLMSSKPKNGYEMLC